MPSARTHVRDIGHYVARIVADSRTLNKAVFAYNEVLTQHQIFDILERLSKESLERKYVCYPLFCRPRAYRSQLTLNDLPTRSLSLS